MLPRGARQWLERNVRGTNRNESSASSDANQTPSQRTTPTCLWTTSIDETEENMSEPDVEYEQTKQEGKISNEHELLLTI